jgi:hypothetical protein
MDVKGMSKKIATKIEEKFRPLSNHLLPGDSKVEEKSSKSMVEMPKGLKMDIDQIYKSIK